MSVMKSAAMVSDICPASALKGYYRLHSRIYDATRWTFLFGREEVLRTAAQYCSRPPRRILEVGCGTGRNLERLARLFPDADIVGVDLCGSMLDRARRKGALRGERVSLREASYDAPLAAGSFDLVLFSYALTMFGPHMRPALDAAMEDLAPGGLLAVADFHDTPLGTFRGWMGMNHVRLDGQVLPALAERCAPAAWRIGLAWGGLWRWFVYVGRKAV